MGLFTGYWRITGQVRITVDGVEFYRDFTVYTQGQDPKVSQAMGMVWASIPPLHTWVPGWSLDTGCNRYQLVEKKLVSSCVTELSGWGGTGGGGGIEWGGGGGGGIEWGGGGGGINW